MHMIEDEDEDDDTRSQTIERKHEKNTLFIEINSCVTQVNVGKGNHVAILIQNQDLQRQENVGFLNQETVDADGESYDSQASRHEFTSPVIQDTKYKNILTQDVVYERKAKRRNGSVQEKSRNASASERQVKYPSKKKHNRAEGPIVKTVYKQLAPADLSESNIEFFKRSYSIMMRLQTPRDMGHWKTFDDLVVTLSNEYTSDHDVQVMILMERGQAACYNNRLEDSKKWLKKARSMVNCTSSPNSSLLQGRIHYYLSALYRRLKKPGKAIDCVVIADQNLNNIGPVLDMAMLTYERANALMDFILKCADPKPSLVEDVMSNFRRCIEYIIRLKEDPNNELYMKSHRYAFMKMAMLLLDCRTAIGRQRTVSKASIEEAKKCLDEIKKNYWDQTSRGEKIQFFLAQSDLHYRMNLHQKAEEYAVKALDMAQEFGFNTEIKPARERLEHIKLTRNSNKYDDHEDTLSIVPVNGSQGDIVSDVCADGNHGDTVSDVDANSNHGSEATSDVCNIGRNGKKEPESSEGHVGDVSNSSDSDFMKNPSYL